MPLPLPVAAASSRCVIEKFEPGQGHYGNQVEPTSSTALMICTQVIPSNPPKAT
jgi:hypothetical protein